MDEAKQNEAFRATARRLFAKEGQLEIDEDAPVSLSGDGGAYVQAWVWVSQSEIKE